MRCTKCGSENLADSLYCVECGTALAVVCVACAAEHPPGAKFCRRCGTALRVGEAGAAPAAAAPTEAPRTPAEAERRQLTVLFCDLVDSTALSRQLDAEEFREVVQAYQDVCAAVVARLDGYLAQYLGDGILVYFGYPQAHEDSAQRAVRAGLAMVEAVATLAPPVSTVTRGSLRIRVGIHTGPVVVGEPGSGGRREHLAMGDTPNIASRLQAAAEPNGVVMSAATLRLVQGMFVIRPLGQIELKGVAEPMTAYQVLRRSGMQSRLDVAVASGLTPLIGREQEVGLLLDRWQLALEGVGQIVLLSGEAGIGKSRLVQVLHERVGEQPHTWLECRCAAEHRHSAFAPVIELLQRLMRWGPDDSEEERLAKLERGLAAVNFDLAQTIPLFGALLSLPLPARYAPLEATPDVLKRRTMQALLQWLLRLAEWQPVIFVIDDVQWVDPSSLELIDLLFAQSPTTPILTLLLYRSEFQPAWALRSHVTPIVLGRLTRPQVAALIASIVRGDRLPEGVVQQIIAKTDGVPLFVEELTKMVVEAGVLRKDGTSPGRGPSPQTLAIPATLHDSLMARLDQLAPAKETAQLGATIGREFSYELLRAISPLEEVALQASLARLVETELLYQRGLPPQAAYVFKHALIRDVAYESLLRSKRQHVHQQIAFALSERFPEFAERRPEVVAQHFTEAGLGEQATRYWYLAGQRAMARSEMGEASAHLARGIEVVHTRPASPERANQELILQTALAVVWQATKGYAAPEAENALIRARELCDELGVEQPLGWVLIGLAVCYVTRADYTKTLTFGQELFALAERAQSRTFRMWAHQLLGHGYYWTGDLRHALDQYERAAALYDPEKHRPRYLGVLQDPQVICLSMLAITTWCLGEVARAERYSEQAEAWARKLAHPFSTVWGLTYGAILHYFRGDALRVRETVEALVLVTQEQGFSFYLGAGSIMRGWAVAETSSAEDGITEICDGLALFDATGGAVASSGLLAMLARAYQRAGRLDEAQRTLERAMTFAEQRNERFYEAELQRLQGELLLKRVDSSPFRVDSTVNCQLSTVDFSDAEACFRRALDTARAQEAKAWELRAALSLARLWRADGRRRDAWELLTPICGWFGDRGDTADVQAARRVLEELR